jgi:hypothetical protein
MIESGVQACNTTEHVFCSMAIINMVVDTLVYLYGHLMTRRSLIQHLLV